MGKCDKETSFGMLDYFFSQGGNFIDTASNYQNEESEIWIGEWMAARKNRDQMVIATKFTTNWTVYQGHEAKVSANYGGNNKKSLRLSVDASLKKLQTEYIDLLYIHCMYTVSSPMMSRIFSNMPCFRSPLKLLSFTVGKILTTPLLFAPHTSETNPLLDSLYFYILRQQR
jgi:aryl-alcohol dehydrogenase-like predicted oxidoreductase